MTPRFLACATRRIELPLIGKGRAGLRGTMRAVLDSLNLRCLLTN